ncbi:MAG: type II toxin-antitoxin system HicA family toxin [Spirochaetia bacterium]|nr:type II toxin-antitoxin system HicA family toxin [Spirochaetia bacterium]
MTGKDLIKLLKDHGWVLDRISGSHHIMIKEGRRSIPIPVHGKKEIPIGLAKRILKQAGIERRNDKKVFISFVD